jgi:hypothetical protein
MQTIGPQNMGNNPAMTMASRRAPWRSGRREPYLQRPICPKRQGKPKRGIRDGLLDLETPERNPGSTLDPFHGLDDIPGIGVTVPMPD